MNSEIASLSTDFNPSISEEFEISSFEQSELDIISSFYGDKYDSIEKLRERFKRVSGVMLDTSKNSHGFSLSEQALKSIADHFEKTKHSKILHRKFLDHKYQEIEKQVGKLTKIWYDDKEKVLKYKGIDDKKHPTIARSDSFNSVSATIAHGDRSCSSCKTKYRNLRTPNCSCTDAHPVSNKAMNIELSYVSFPAYSGATSQVDEFSGDIQSEISSFFATPKDDSDDEQIEPLAVRSIKTDAGTSFDDGEIVSLSDEEDGLDESQSTLNDIDPETLNKIISLSKNVKELRELLASY